MRHRRTGYYCCSLTNLRDITEADNYHEFKNLDTSKNWMSQLMRLWYLSHTRPAKAQASLRIRKVSPEPLLFAHMKYGSRRRVWPKIRHLAPLSMRVWKMSLRRTENALILWVGSNYSKIWVMCTKDTDRIANSVDPDLCLHCLLRPVCLKT